MPRTPPFPIDAVYTWVDGHTPAFRASLAATRAAWHEPVLPFSDEPHRFRDSGELRYSLRSLTANAPWVRDIYLVTNGELPAWLDTTAPRLHLVRHTDIIAPTNLPTFNSAAIEHSFRNIPGIAEHVISFNDDIFLARRSHPGHFFDRTGQPIASATPLRRVDPRAPGTRRAYTVSLLSREFGAQTWPDIPHQPIPYTGAIARRVYETWPDEVDRTISHRFRHPDDVVFPVVVQHTAAMQRPLSGWRTRHQLLDPRYRVAPTAALNLAMPGGELVKRTWPKLRWIEATRPRSFCINDSVYPGDDLGARVFADAMRMLARMFPTPSRFELPGPPALRENPYPDPAATHTGPPTSTER
ncbi:MAG TPA: stealth conserved region 3 domain-containing protein [Tepidiformaceae bacterium]|nr:stealth conserved region 3 domain-containing protein [Tepidiformaceae bacterium]